MEINGGQNKSIDESALKKLQYECANNYPAFSKKLTNDIEWAQHMGSNFWAKYIFEELYYPRKTKLTLNL